MIKGGFTAASEYGVEYHYADGVVHRCRSTAANNWFGGVVDPKGRKHGVKFIGVDGWILTRGKIEASSPTCSGKHCQPRPRVSTRATITWAISSTAFAREKRPSASRKSATGRRRSAISACWRSATRPGTEMGSRQATVRGRRGGQQVAIPRAPQAVEL